MWLQHGAHSQDFAFLKVPHGFHKHSLGSWWVFLIFPPAILLCLRPLHTFTYAHSSHSSSDIFSSFTAGCLLVRNWLYIPALGILEQSLVIIGPSLLLLLSFCSGIRHHLRPVFEIVSSGRWEL